MHAITGPEFSRRAELIALAVTVLAAIAAVIVPALYVVVLPAACAATAVLAPTGRRLASAVVVWFPVSLAVVLAVAPSANWHL